MLVPVKWLKEFVDVKISAEELADKLVSCGFEIEEIINQADLVQGVVTGKITAIEQHPNADKLRVCTVDIAKTAPVKIVTNAQNVAVGDTVPVALDGAKLASGKRIYRGELRGVVSEGMFCGGAEINLHECDYKGAGEDCVLVLREGTAVGADINAVMDTDDVILDVAITANRTDANSILGIAREVAAVTGEKLKMPSDYAKIPTRNAINAVLALENDAPELCPRYLAAMVEDVVIEESPDYIKRRLKSAGLRPINNIVDITNYVLLEVGQPMHAFDLKAIEGGKIVVRRASNGEKLLALDDKEYTLGEDDLAICNAREPMAIAGVMGGKNYSIAADTRTIVFESARFARDAIRRTSRKLGLRSDSSARFEKGIDFYSQVLGMEKALGMITANGWGKIAGGTLDAYPVKAEIKSVEFTAADIERILGVSVPEAKIAEILNSLTIPTIVENGMLKSEIPGYREDIVGVNDLAEEVIRIYGYDHIETTLMPGATMSAGGRSPAQETSDKIKATLVGKGGYEAITYSFISPKAWDMLRLPAESPLRNAIRLACPLGEDYSVMRTTLAYSMLKTVALNYLRGNKAARFFEVAKTYLPKALPLAELPVENNVLCLGAYGEKEDFYSFKSIIEDLLYVLRIDAKYSRDTLSYMHPTRTAKIIAADGTEIGYLGEVKAEVADSFGIDKRAYLAELDFEYLIANAANFKGFKVASKYPSVERDLALVCGLELEADELLGTIKTAAGELLTDAKIFDVYTGGQMLPGKKSVAVKLTFQSMERTLKDDEVNAEIEAILAALGAKDIKIR